MPAFSTTHTANRVSVADAWERVRNFKHKDLAAWCQRIVDLSVILAERGFLTRLSKLRPSKDAARNLALEILDLARQPKKLRQLTRRLQRLQCTKPALFGLVSEWLRYKLMNEVLETPWRPAQPGWEGAYLMKVEDVAGLVEWLDLHIRVKDVFLPQTDVGRQAQDYKDRESGSTVRNAYRLASWLGILTAIPPEPKEPLSPRQEVAILRRLRAVCQELVEQRSGRKRKRCDGSDPGAPRRPRGRPYKGDPAADERLYKDWRASGQTLPEFASSRSIPPKETTRQIDRARKRAERR